MSNILKLVTQIRKTLLWSIVKIAHVVKRRIPSCPVWAERVEIKR